MRIARVSSNPSLVTRTTLWIAASLCCVACAPDVVLPPRGAVLETDVEALIQEHVALARENPGHARAHGTLGLVYEANLLFEPAAQCFALAAELDPSQPLWALHQAICARENGDPQDEESFLLATLPRLRSEPAVAYRLGTVYLESGRAEEAKAEFQIAANIAPENPEPLVGLAKAMIALGESQNAKPLLERALQLDSTYKSAHYQLGLVLRAEGLEERAQAELALGVGAAPRFLADPLTSEKNRYAISATELTRRGILHLGRGEFEAAISLLERALRAQPKHELARKNLGWAYVGRRQFADALTVIGPALAPETESHEPHLIAAFANLGLDESEEALRHADLAIEHAPEQAEAHYTRARALGVMRRFEEARAAYRTAIELDAVDKRFHVYLGLMELEAGRYEVAKNEFRKTLEIDPAYLSAHVNLAYVLLILGELEAAERQIGELRRLAPNHPRLEELEAGLETLK